MTTSNLERKFKDVLNILLQAQLEVLYIFSGVHNDEHLRLSSFVVELISGQELACPLAPGMYIGCTAWKIESFQVVSEHDPGKILGTLCAPNGDFLSFCIKRATVSCDQQQATG